MALNVNTKKEDTGDKREFQSTPGNILGNEKPVDFNSVAPKQHYPAKGHDTYTDLPGDGIVPG